MPKQWFVGCTLQSRETWAKDNLENQAFETYLPMCVSMWAKMPKLKPFLPGYIFVALDQTKERWRAVFSTRGIKSVICSGERPQPVPDWIIGGIRERENEQGLVCLPPKVQCKFKKGDRIAIRGNPVDALFEEALDGRRAAVFISLLGRSNRLVVPLTKLVNAPLAGVAAVA